MSNLQLLQEEVKLQASMDHPHIARVFETFEDEQYIDIIMESCEGRSTTTSPPIYIYIYIQDKMMNML